MDAGVGGVEERVDYVVDGASEAGAMAADSEVEGARQEDMVEEEDTQRLAVAPGRRSTVSKRKVKQSRRHNFDTTPSAFAFGNDDSAREGHCVRGDECEDDHGHDGGDCARQDGEAGEGDAQRLSDIAVHVAAAAGDECEEVILTTIMVVNAAVLLEATGNKVKAFRALVKATEAETTCDSRT